MHQGAALTEHTEPARATANDVSAVRLDGARLSYGDRTLWQDLDLAVAAGEFVAVLGPNGSGKTSLLKVLLGQQGLSAGTAAIPGAPPRPRHPQIGNVPQHQTYAG
ncbi:ATP-binding cassette domain-containing protein, partial [Nocardia brasiliensis]|uniref:ATP-binding cassette domain-containing protein n=1 Tax=Nocardia brasiliensis TaxID=37326 RepID=UPI003D7B94E2